MTNNNENAPIIVGVSLTDESSYLLEKVKGLVADRRNVVAVHVVEPPTIFAADPESTTVLTTALAEERAQSAQRLEELCQPLGIDEHLVIEGHPAHLLHEIAEQRNARAIAIGTHGFRGWRAALGETANAVLHGASCDVFAILTKDYTDKPQLTYDRILIAVDMTDESEKVLNTGLRIAELYSATPTLMTVVKPFKHTYPGLDFGVISDQSITFEHEVERFYATQLSEMAARHKIRDHFVRHGNVAEEIHQAASEGNYDLVVVGSHGRHGLQLIFGSTPNAVLHGLTSDLFAVRL